MASLTVKMVVVSASSALLGAAITASGFLAFGGSDTQPAVQATTSSTAVATTSSSSNVKTSGVLEKKPGEKAAYGCPLSGGGTCAVEFTLDKITDCTGAYPGDDLGPGKVRKLAWFTVRTAAEFDQNPASGKYLPTFSAYNMHAINSAGVTGGSIGANTTWQCAKSGETLPHDWAPGQTYAGAVEIYVPTDTKKLVLMLGQIGWSWDY